MPKIDAREMNFFGDDARLRHVGMAVRSIDGAAPGAAKRFDPPESARVAFIEPNGALCELAEPVHERSPVDGCLEHNMKLYHLFFEVTDVERALEHASRHVFRPLDKPKPAAFEGRRIAWCFARSWGFASFLKGDRVRRPRDFLSRSGGPLRC